MPDASPILNYRFGPFVLKTKDRILEKDGERVLVTPKVVDTLVVLVENAPQVVLKEDLIKAVWPDVAVAESGLTRNMSALRKALEEGDGEGTYVETIPRRGYRFVAPVEVEPVESLSAESAPQESDSVRPEAAALWRRDLKVAAIAGLAGLTLATWFVNRPLPASPPVEAPVRIGEHLLYKLSPQETARAVQQFETAIAQNPNSAAAHAGLAVSLMHLTALGVKSMGEVQPAVGVASRRALQLDSDSAMAHYAAGMMSYFAEWNFDAAEESMQRALRLQPGSVQFRFGLVYVKIAKGDLDGAERIAREALEADPAAPAVGAAYCRIFYLKRDFHRAESECKRVLDREPGYGIASYYLALSLGFLDRYGEAREALAKSAMQPGVIETDEAWLRGREGDRRPAAKILEIRREMVLRRTVTASAKLLPAIVAGNLDEAFDAVDAGLVERAPELLSLRVDPRLEPLRSDSRYAGALARFDAAARR